MQGATGMKNITQTKGIWIHEQSRENQGKLKSPKDIRREDINSNKKDKDIKNDECKNKGKMKATIT